MMALLIRNIKELVGVERHIRPFVPGPEMNRLETIKDAWLLTEGERIRDFGPMDLCPANPRVGSGESLTVIDADGRMIFPSFCDSHTHIVYAGSREIEYVDKIRGLSYEEIAKRGGGILNSAAKLHDTSEEELAEQAMGRLEEIVLLGTGAVEIKSGYGLTVEDELKMLRVVRKLRELSPVTLVWEHMPFRWNIREGRENTWTWSLTR
jgi:imidazolonepropionase